MNANHSPSDAQYLIIGNGVAGITAAQAIRHADPAGGIVLIGDEGEPYYYRASLSEWISGQTTDEMLPGRTVEFYDQMHIEQVAGHVAQVDSVAKQVHLTDSRAIGYRKLLIATGARADVYPVEGLDQVMVFRSLADARAIKGQLGRCGRVLIVGGGILGLELAGALHKMSIPHIGIVQRSAPIGKPLLDMPAAAWLQERMRADSVDLFVGDTVTRVEGQTAHFKSGQMWDFNVLVQAVGITPTYPKLSGLEAEKGIRIDARCRTSLPDVYAAGDCTETRTYGSDGVADRTWQTTRIWLDCARQGKIAGQNMAGQDAALSAQPFFNASIIYTHLYAYIGEPHGEAGEAHVWQKGDGYRKLRIVDGRLAGALLLGERHGSMAIFRAIGQPVAEFGADIARPDFSWNDLTGQDWDYMFY